jgi:transcriptional regulator with XRE-family HTH domain
VNPKRKVDAALIEKVKALRVKGRTQEEIGVSVGVTQGTISGILRSNGLGGKLVRRDRGAGRC